jgi:hypothetical protein
MNEARFAFDALTAYAGDVVQAMGAPEVVAIEWRVTWCGPICRDRIRTAY